MRRAFKSRVIITPIITVVALGMAIDQIAAVIVRGPGQ